MTKVNDWNITLLDLLNNENIPDPYIIDSNSLNAFDVIKQMPKKLVNKFQLGLISLDKFIDNIELYHDLKQQFLNNEIKRVLDPDFKPRFTEKLANEINQKENELTR